VRRGLPTAPAGREALGRALVAAQFALLLPLGALGTWGAALETVPADAAALAAAAVALGAWTLGANRPGNFNVHPRPARHDVLVTGGPYRWVRHPMYATLLLAALAAVRTAPVRWAAVALLLWAALAAVLWVKSSLEEAWLAEHHPGYAGYRARTRRFLPGLL
jgi:protein-S-isoprenylcysteine O-methyltransferase Ste14